MAALIRDLRRKVLDELGMKTHLEQLVDILRISEGTFFRVVAAVGCVNGRNGHKGAVLLLLLSRKDRGHR